MDIFKLKFHGGISDIIDVTSNKSCHEILKGLKC